MASSNRHWPSMFKSKPNHQWHHELNSPLVSSAACHRTAYTPGLGCEERAPEPKPRWNPRPEQIRILEAIFNSGMVNPPRDEIRRIRAQLQEYGQVGDANVFYWFQNRKSRTKHKQRQAAASKTTTTTTHLHHPTAPAPQPRTTKTTTTPNSYSSSSSDKSSTGKTLSVGTTSAATAAHVIDLMNSPTASVNNQHLHHHQPFVQASSEFLSEPFFFPAQQSPAAPLDLGQGFCLSEAADQGVGGCQNFLLSELMLMSNCPSKIRNGDRDDHQKMKLHDQQHFSYAAATAVSDPIHHFLPPDSQILQGLHHPVGPTRSSTVFINDVCFEVGAGPFGVREAFGEDAVLIQSSGQPVLTNEWGITVQPLQHGGFYYLLRHPAAPSPDDRTVDLI